MAGEVEYVQSHHNRGRGSAEENRLYIFSREVFFYCNPLDRPVTVESHCCVLLVSAYGVPFEVDFGVDHIKASALLAGPLRRRKVMAEGSGVVGFYIMPESPLFAHLVNTLPRNGFRPIYRGQMDSLNVELIALYEGRADVRQTLDVSARMHQLLAPSPATPGVVPSAVELTEVVRANPGVTLHQFAARYGVSYTRMSRMFTQTVGISFREYKNWLKHKRVLQLMSTDLSLTEIAQEAGFADLAQFTRIYKRWYGSPPSYVRQHKNIKVFLTNDLTNPT